MVSSYASSSACPSVTIPKVTRKKFVRKKFITKEPFSEVIGHMGQVKGHMGQGGIVPNKGRWTHDNVKLLHSLPSLYSPKYNSPLECNNRTFLLVLNSCSTVYFFLHSFNRTDDDKWKNSSEKISEGTWDQKQSGEQNITLSPRNIAIDFQQEAEQVCPARYSR